MLEQIADNGGLRFQVRLPSLPARAARCAHAVRRCGARETSNCAAPRPSPSDDPVMNTRAITFLSSGIQDALRPTPDSIYPRCSRKETRKPECFVLSRLACKMSRGSPEASSMLMRRLAMSVLFAAVLSNVLVWAQQPDSDDESQFRFRFVGPLCRQSCRCRRRSTRGSRARTMRAQPRVESGNRPMAGTAGPRIRQAARRSDRRARRRTFRSQNGMGGDRRSLGDPR